MDTIGWFIATLHQMLGHATTARFLGQPIGNVRTCVLCRYERGEASRQDVIDQIGTNA